MFYGHGLTRAKFLDAYREETGKVVGPLHGIPISIKDMVDLKGVATTLGNSPFLGVQRFWLR